MFNFIYFRKIFKRGKTDSYSGSFPLDFVFHYLGMTSEAQDTANILPDSNLDKRTDTPIVEQINPPAEARPLSNFSSSSGATEESLTAYAERTLHTLGAVDANLDISFLDTLRTLDRKSFNRTTKLSPMCRT